MKDVNRFSQVFIAELAMEREKAEIRLQDAINAGGDIDEKVKEVKSKLDELVYTEMLLNKWQQLVSASQSRTNNE